MAKAPWIDDDGIIAKRNSHRYADGFLLIVFLAGAAGTLYHAGLKEGEARAAQVKCALSGFPLEVHPMTGERLDR